jgi:hypothetical protein
MCPELSTLYLKNYIVFIIIIIIIIIQLNWKLVFTQWQWSYNKI